MTELSIGQPEVFGLAVVATGHMGVIRRLLPVHINRFGDLDTFQSVAHGVTQDVKTEQVQALVAQ